MRHAVFWVCSAAFCVFSAFGRRLKALNSAYTCILRFYAELHCRTQFWAGDVASPPICVPFAEAEAVPNGPRKPAHGRPSVGSSPHGQPSCGETSPQFACAVGRSPQWTGRPWGGLPTSRLTMGRTPHGRPPVGRLSGPVWNGFCFREGDTNWGRGDAPSFGR